MKVKDYGWKISIKRYLEDFSTIEYLINSESISSKVKTLDIITDMLVYKHGDVLFCLQYLGEGFCRIGERQSIHGDTFSYETIAIEDAAETLYRRIVKEGFNEDR